jgi:hypothetical protein
VRYENIELPKETKDGKMSWIDVLVFTARGERINVEIQVIHQHDVSKRVVFFFV